MCGIPTSRGLLLSNGSPIFGVNNKLDNKTNGKPIGSSAFVVSSLQGGYVLEGLWDAVLGSDVDFAVEDLTALTREGGERKFNAGRTFSSDREWR
jgi:hypothetical protein